MNWEEREQPYMTGDEFVAEVLDSLQRHKLDATKEMELNFFLHLPSKEAAVDSATKIRPLGLTTDISHTGDEPNPWLCMTKDTFVPEPDRLRPIGETMIGLARTHGGTFDGWDTPVGRPSGLKLWLYIAWLIISLPFRILWGFITILRHCVLPGRSLMQGQQALEAGDPDKAIDIAQKMIKKDTMTEEAYHLLAHGYLEKKDNQAAVDAFTKAIELAEDDDSKAEALLNRGVALDNMGRHHEAIAGYGEALELKPDYASAYYNLGNAYHHLGDRQQCLVYLQYAIYLRPEFLDKAREDEDFKGALSEEEFAFVATPPAAGE